MSWYLAATVNTQPSEDLYIYINDPMSEAAAAAGYSVSQIGSYTYLDYVIIGGGGSGGNVGYLGFNPIQQGGGGGGSGNLKSTMTYNITNNGYIYSINTITNVGGTLIIPVNTTIISVTIGDGNGGNTSILFDSVIQISAAGGSNGFGAGAAGVGGNGFNGGGGACGISAAGGGTGIGGANGQAAPSNDQPGMGGGVGGYQGGGWYPGAPGNFNAGGENAGGGGGAGTAVILVAGSNTGGRGAGAYQTLTNITSQPGVDYTGAGGGGAAMKVGSGYEALSSGGKGYAILYFHN